MAARIIMLNGTCAVGKSTVVGALRPLLPDTFCSYASDQLAAEGFRPTAPDARWRGREAFFDGFHRSIAGFAAAGLDMVVEHIVERASWRADLDRLLLPFDVFWVGLFAPLEEVERRERARGTARSAKRGSIGARTSTATITSRPRRSSRRVPSPR